LKFSHVKYDALYHLQCPVNFICVPECLLLLYMLVQCAYMLTVTAALTVVTDLTAWLQ